MNRFEALKTLALACLASTISLAPTIVRAQAESYPSRPIRVIVPAPAGGPSDTIARVIGKQLTQMWGQPVVVENRPGGNSIIANGFVAKAPPDGYTLLLTVDYSMTVNPHTYKELPYDPLKSFAHVTTIGNAVCVVAVNAKVPVESFAELVKYASSLPNGISVGVGTVTTELISERLASLANLKFVKVPFKGSGEVAPALLGGHIDATIAGFTPFQEHTGKGSRIKVLASTGATRSPATPTVPTLEELGFPGFRTGVWMGMSAPAATPAAIVNKLSEAVNSSMNRAEVKETFRQTGLDLLPGSPASMTELIRQESDEWHRIVREKGIRVQ